jgi:stage II sporulation protein E
MEAAVAVLAGFVFSRAMIFETLAPFGLSAVAAASPVNGFFVLIGSCFGYLLPGGPDYSARYVSAAAAVFLIKWLLWSVTETRHHPAFGPLVAAAASAVTGMAVIISNGLITYDIVLYTAETLLCGGSVFFLQKAFACFKDRTKIWGLNKKELAGVTITVCIILLAISRLQYYGISLGRIFGVICILIAARYGKEARGCITGVAVGIILSLSNVGMVQILAGYGFGGLVGGIFAPLGRLPCTAGFLLAGAVTGIYPAISQQAPEGLIEMLLGSAVFLFLPEKLMCKVSALFVPAAGGGFEGRYREAVKSRLNSAAGAFTEISATVSEVTKKLSRLRTDDISEIYSSAADQVCKSCGMKMFCWETAYNDTMGALNDLNETLKKAGRVRRDDLPKHFASRCCRLGEMIDCINVGYAEYSAKKTARKDSDQLRGVLSQELGSLAGLLKDIDCSLSEIGETQRVDSENVREALCGFGINVEDAQCSLDPRGRMTVTARVDPGRLNLDREKLTTALSKTCGRGFTSPVVTACEDGESALELKFVEKPPLSAAFGHSLIQKSGEVFCGDACASFVCEDERAYMLLSDGMGCGGRAAVDSNFVVELLKRLIRSGFGYETAIKVVNSAMMLKSSDETFATVDIACIDLFTGAAEFIKAGAPQGYLRRLGRVERVAMSSMPVGIIENARYERAGTRLRKGDMAILMSDGALAGDESVLSKEVESFDGSDPASLARKLALNAKAMQGKHDDDVTVMVACLK